MTMERSMMPERELDRERRRSGGDGGDKPDRTTLDAATKDATSGTEKRVVNQCLP